MKPAPLQIIPGCTLVPLDERHLPALLNLYRQCEDFLALGPQPKASESMVWQDLNDVPPGYYRGLLDESQRLWAVIAFLPDGFERVAGCAYIQLLMVAAPCRRKGFGKVLVRAVEGEVCSSPAVQRIRAHVQVNNPDAISFWKQMGYQIDGLAIDNEDQTTVLPLLKI